MMLKTNMTLSYSLAKKLDEFYVLYPPPKRVGKIIWYHQVVTTDGKAYLYGYEQGNCVTNEGIVVETTRS